MHHIISDGISTAVLAGDLLALYRGEELGKLRVQYRDFVKWQESEGIKAMKRDQEAYWLEEFTGEIPVLYLPTDNTRPKEQGFTGAEVNFRLDREQSRRLKKWALEEKATLFMVMYAI